MTPRDPDREGFVARDGVELAFSLYDHDGPTILLMPTWSIVHSRHWKAQIPYLSRHFRVVTFDGRGNGRSDRPRDPGAYSDDEFVADAIAVLDATETTQAVLAGVSLGAHWSALLTAWHPDRVVGAILISPSTSLVSVPHPERQMPSFDERLDRYEGWDKYNVHYWRSNYGEFADFFFSQVFSEAHSTKQREDAVEWALETDPEVLIAAEIADPISDDLVRSVLAGIHCPLLIIHGTEDRITTVESGVKLSELTGASLLLLKGGGHLPQARDPVRVNLAIREFVERVGSPARARA